MLSLTAPILKYVGLDVHAETGAIAMIIDPGLSRHDHEACHRSRQRFGVLQRRETQLPLSARKSMESHTLRILPRTTPPPGKASLAACFFSVPSVPWW